MILSQEKVLMFIKSFALIVLSLTASAYTYQYGRSVNESNYRSFSVTGEGMVTTVPDTAQFSVSVVTDGGMNIADTQKKNVDKMNKIIDFVKNQGVDAKDVKTTQYAINPQRSYPVCAVDKTCASSQITGYAITQSIAIKTRDTEKVGALLAGVTDNGANSVSDITFVVGDEAKTKGVAREAAIEDGRKQAVSIADAAGFKLGKLTTIYEESPINGISPMPYATDKVASSQIMQAPVPTIEPGSNEQKVRMTLTYEIH